MGDEVARRLALVGGPDHVLAEPDQQLGLVAGAAVAAEQAPRRTRRSPACASGRRRPPARSPAAAAGRRPRSAPCRARAAARSRPSGSTGAGAADPSARAGSGGRPPTRAPANGGCGEPVAPAARRRRRAAAAPRPTCGSIARERGDRIAAPPAASSPPAGRRGRGAAPSSSHQPAAGLQDLRERLLQHLEGEPARGRASCGAASARSSSRIDLVRPGRRPRRGGRRPRRRAGRPPPARRRRARRRRRSSPRRGSGSGRARPSPSTRLIERSIRPLEAADQLVHRDAARLGLRHGDLLHGVLQLVAGGVELARPGRAGAAARTAVAWLRVSQPSSRRPMRSRAWTL